MNQVSSEIPAISAGPRGRGSARAAPSCECAGRTARQGLMLTTGPQDGARILFVDTAFESITGYRTEDVAGREIRSLFEGDENRVALAGMRQAVAKGQSASVVIRNYRKDGAVAWNALDIDPVRDDAGAVTHFIGTIHDVNEREALQARFRQLEKMHAIGQLTSGVAHDFNNILGATRSFAALLADAAPASSPQYQYASRIIAACDRAADLVRQLLVFTRATDAPREYLAVHDVVNEVVSLLSGRLPDAISLSVTHHAADLAVVANESQLAQILLNLAMNACDAMTGGAGALLISSCEVMVTEGAAAPFVKGLKIHPGGFVCATGELKPRTPYARLSVVDSGTGIAEDIAGKIFEPFFTTKDKRSGSGLGLAIVNSIVAAHDGVIAVHSQAGKGSVFDVYLPADKSGGAGHQQKPAPAPNENVRGAERILIVDDEVDIADAVSISLRNLGYKAVPVYSPVDALALFKRDPRAWDVVITDQSMPRMKGLALIRKIKFIRPDIKALLCTGHDDGSAKGSAESDGVDAFLIKPLPTEVLAAKIRHLVERTHRQAITRFRGRTSAGDL